MKSVHVTQLKRAVEIATDTLLLDALLSEQVPVLMACGGRGICATCHCFIKSGEDSLTPMTDREKRTLSRLTGAGTNSRLACQARVIGPGVETALPEGVYVQSFNDLEDLVGKRTKVPIRHPLDGRVLIQKKKIITRTAIMSLADVDFAIDDVELL